MTETEDEDRVMRCLMCNNQTLENKFLMHIKFHHMIQREELVQKMYRYHFQSIGRDMEIQTNVTWVKDLSELESVLEGLEENLEGPLGNCCHQTCATEDTLGLVAEDNDFSAGIEAATSTVFNNSNATPAAVDTNQPPVDVNDSLSVVDNEATLSPPVPMDTCQSLPRLDNNQSPVALVKNRLSDGGLDYNRLLDAVDNSQSPVAVVNNQSAVDVATNPNHSPADDCIKSNEDHNHNSCPELRDKAASPPPTSHEVSPRSEVVGMTVPPIVMTLPSGTATCQSKPLGPKYATDTCSRLPAGDSPVAHTKGPLKLKIKTQDGRCFSEFPNDSSPVPPTVELTPAAIRVDLGLHHQMISEALSGKEGGTHNTTRQDEPESDQIPSGPVEIASSVETSHPSRKKRLAGPKSKQPLSWETNSETEELRCFPSLPQSANSDISVLVRFSCPYCTFYDRRKYVVDDHIIIEHSNTSPDCSVAARYGEAKCQEMQVRLVNCGMGRGDYPGRGESHDSEEEGIIASSSWVKGDATLPPGWSYQVVKSEGGVMETLLLSPEKALFRSRDNAADHLVKQGLSLVNVSGYREQLSSPSTCDGLCEGSCNYFAVDQAFYRPGDYNATRKELRLTIGTDVEEDRSIKIREKLVKSADHRGQRLVGDALEYEKPENRLPRPWVLLLAKEKEGENDTEERVGGGGDNRRPDSASKTASTSLRNGYEKARWKIKARCGDSAKSSKLGRLSSQPSDRAGSKDRGYLSGVSGKRKRSSDDTSDSGSSSKVSRKITSSSKSSGVNDDLSRGKKQARGSSRDSTSSRRSETYVQCCNKECGRWRSVKYVDESDVPEYWVCKMNTDPKNRKCGVGGNSFQGNNADLMLKFSCGSLVWAKLDNFPWWPGMIDPCPVSGESYWLDEVVSLTVPTRYNVVFFEGDHEVSRAWVEADNIRRLIFPTKIPETSERFRSRIELALKVAEKAKRMRRRERTKALGFAALPMSQSDKSTVNNDRVRSQEDNNELDTRRKGSVDTESSEEDLDRTKSFRKDKKSQVQREQRTAEVNDKSRSPFTREEKSEAAHPTQPPNSHTQSTTSTTSSSSPSSNSTSDTSCSLLDTDLLKPEIVFANSNPGWERAHPRPPLPSDVLLTLAVRNLDPANNLGASFSNIVAFLALHFPYFNRNLGECKDIVRKAYDINSKEETGKETFRIKSSLVDQLSEKIKKYVNKYRPLVLESMLVPDFLDPLIERFIQGVDSHPRKSIRPPYSYQMLAYLALVHLSPPTSLEQIVLFLNFLFPFLSTPAAEKAAFKQSDFRVALDCDENVELRRNKRGEEFYLLRDGLYPTVLHQVRTFFSITSNYSRLRNSIYRVEFVETLLPNLQVSKKDKYLNL